MRQNPALLAVVQQVHDDMQVIMDELEIDNGRPPAVEDGTLPFLWIDWALDRRLKLLSWLKKHRKQIDAPWRRDRRRRLRMIIALARVRHEINVLYAAAMQPTSAFEKIQYCHVGGYDRERPPPFEVIFGAIASQRWAPPVILPAGNDAAAWISEKLREMRKEEEEYRKYGPRERREQ